jgi:exonuclease SbcC
LVLQAFGSYAGTLEVDFARMGRHGVFAITGPTGAGKSTIFDAIVYALYGDLPGFRADGNVRSQYADPSTRTRVTLEFEVGGETWTIERAPRQAVPRRRGSGEAVLQAPSALLRRSGEDAGGFSRQSDVAARVIDLVGLTKDQFEQVVLIPQGRFEEVLKADTRQRSALLTQLFPVDIYARVTDALKAIAQARQGDFDRAQAEQRSAVDGVAGEAERLVAGLPDGIDPGALGRWARGPADTPPGGEQAGGEPPGGEQAGGEPPGGEQAGGEPPGLDALLDDVARVEAELGALVAGAATERDQARLRRDDTVAAADAWDRWQADLAAARSFEDEEERDAHEEAELDRARSVSALAGALAGWQQAVAELAGAGVERDGLVARIGAAWEGDLPAGELTRSPQVSELAARIAAEAERLDAGERQFASLSAEAAQIEEARGDLASRNLAHASATEDQEAREAAVEADRVRLDELARQAADRHAAEVALATCQADVDRARRRAAATDAVTRSVAADESATENLEAARRELDRVRGAWRQGLAGRLAAHLVDGEPCPTCGSPDHPAPAALLDGAPDDDAVARAERALEEARQAQSAAQAARVTAEAKLDAIGDGPDLAAAERALVAAADRDQVARRAEADSTTLAADLDRRTGALSVARRALAEESGALSVAAARVEERAAAFERDRQSFVDDHGSFRSLASEAEARRALAAQVRELAGALARVEESEAARDQYRAALAPSMAELGVDGPAALAERMMEPDELARRRAASTGRRDRRTEVRSRIAAYEQAGVPAARPDAGPAEAALAAAEERLTDLVGRQAVVAAAAAHLRTAPDKVAAALAAVERTRRALEEAKTVAQLCAGQGGAGVDERLSLQNWVLAAYLRQVLSQANERLATMTGGRFALRLGEGSADGRRQSGLDLAVFDVNTGQVRPATTLSGGETFMAALALALGLADVVSGGANREIGALFVDEGFGSLDAQSLDGVVEVLRSLEDGGRVVGVISHVTELNRALPNGITVATTTSGSLATLTYPPE